jgi:hypothetical protein
MRFLFKYEPLSNLTNPLYRTTPYCVVKSSCGLFPFLHLDKTEALINFNENLSGNGFISFPLNELNKL